MSLENFKKNWVRIACSGILWVLMLGASYFLLKDHQVSSDNFVNLVIISCIFSFIIAYSDSLFEISILGKLTIRFKQLNNEAEELLKNLQIRNFLLSLDQSIKGGGTFGTNSIIRYGSREFYRVVKDIKENNLISHAQILEKIIQYNKFLPHQQHDNICNAADTTDGKNFLIGDSGLKEEDPEKIRQFFRSGKFDNSQRIKDSYYQDDKQYFLEELETAITNYENLLKVKKWIDESQNH